jgi:hypothetical protein
MIVGAVGAVASPIAMVLANTRRTVVDDGQGNAHREPIASLSGGFVWAWPDVEKWAKATGRKIEDNG